MLWDMESISRSSPSSSPSPCWSQSLRCWASSISISLGETTDTRELTAPVDHSSQLSNRFVTKFNVAVVYQPSYERGGRLSTTSESTLLIHLNTSITKLTKTIPTVFPLLFVCLITFQLTMLGNHEWCFFLSQRLTPFCLNRYLRCLRRFCSEYWHVGVGHPQLCLVLPSSR